MVNHQNESLSKLCHSLNGNRYQFDSCVLETLADTIIISMLWLITDKWPILKMDTILFK